MEENTKELRDYIVAIKKRKGAILAITIVLIILSVSVAYLLPPVYKSSATILIEKQEIPSDLVMSTVTSYASERIQTIQARVMSRTNLTSIIDKFSLYKVKRKYSTTSEIMELMRNDISLDMISSDVADPRTGRPSSVAIAFTISYKSDSPAKTQKVASELTSLYLNENLRNRIEKSEDAVKFFDKEIDRLSNKIKNIENKLAKFKFTNAGSMPEMLALNISSLQRYESDFDTLGTKIKSLEEKEKSLTNQLSKIEPGNPNIVDNKSRLTMLEMEYTKALSSYSSVHPDVVKLQNEIELLKAESGDVDTNRSSSRELVLLRSQLIELKNKYKDSHPDIISVNEKINSLENKLSADLQKPDEEYFQNNPENPVYISLAGQIDSVNIEIQSSKDSIKKIQPKIVDLQKKISESPEIEREYLGLKRDYEQTVGNYQRTKEKQLRANIAQQLESDSKGEKFTLIDPAALPEKPVSPNRPAILFLGLIMSIGCGIGFAFVADAISGTVRGAKSVTALLGVHPLSVIPYVYNLEDKLKQTRIKKRVVVLFIATIFIALLFVHFVVSPLDVMWFRLLRKFDKLSMIAFS